jgi:hypothetical protein
LRIGLRYVALFDLRRQGHEQAAQEQCNHCHDDCELNKRESAVPPRLSQAASAYAMDAET